jgi:hypothetical protein
MTDIVGVECAVIPHNDCGKKDVGVTAWFPNSAHRSVAIGGNANRFIVKGIHPYLPQELVEQHFFFGTGFVAKTFEYLIDSNGGDGRLPVPPRGYPVNHRLIVGKKIGQNVGVKEQHCSVL